MFTYNVSLPASISTSTPSNTIVSTPVQMWAELQLLDRKVQKEQEDLFESLEEVFTDDILRCRQEEASALEAAAEAIGSLEVIDLRPEWAKMTPTLVSEVKASQVTSRRFRRQSRRPVRYFSPVLCRI